MLYGNAIGISSATDDLNIYNLSGNVKDKNNYMWFSLDKSCDDLSTFWIYVLYGLKDNIKNLSEDINNNTLVTDGSYLKEVVKDLNRIENIKLEIHFDKQDNQEFV